MRQRDVFHEVFTLELIMAGVVFLLVLAALGYAVVRRRAGAGAVPSRRSERFGLEAVYVAGLVAVVAFLVGYTALANHREHRDPGGGAPVRVDVTAFQWCWEFTHRRQDGTGPARTVGSCDDGDVPTLVVPTGRTVTLDLTAHDVIHSFWVPDLRYKMDAFPDHTNQITLTLDHEGEWKGRCAEFCGDRHHAMDFRLRAVSPDEYERWLGEHGEHGAGGVGA